MTMELELDTTAERNGTDSAPNCATNRKGEKAGLRARWGAEHVAVFHRVLLENLRDLGTPLLGSDFYREALAAYGSDATLLVLDQPATRRCDVPVRHAGTLADPWASSCAAILRPPRT